MNKVTTIGAPDTQIVLTKVPYLQFEQILHTKIFRQYLDTILLLSKVLRMGIQKTPYQKTYKLQVGCQEFTVDFDGCKRQLDWLEISLVSDKNNKHTTIYHSYNAKCMARILRSIELGNILDAYSVINTMKFDTSNNTQKHMLWMQYVHGTAMAIAVHQALTTLTILYFKNFFCMNQNILTKFTLICKTVLDIQVKWKNLVKITQN